MTIPPRRRRAALLIAQYVQSGSLNGSPLDRTWFTRSALAAGGALRLAMGPAPNLGWAAGPAAAPPSMSTDALGAFGCGA